MTHHQESRPNACSERSGRHPNPDTDNPEILIRITGNPDTDNPEIRIRIPDQILALAEFLLRECQWRQWKHQTTEKARQQYRKLNNKLRKVTQRAKEDWWAQKCEEIEELDKQGKQDQMYKAINDLNRKKSRSSISVKDDDGKLISDPELVRNRWKEYIEKLYNAEGKPHSLNIGPATDMDDIWPDIREEEVATAIKELKNNKAEGIDEIPAELPGPWLTLPLLFLLLLYFLPLYLVVVHYANFVFFSFSIQGQQ